MLPRETSVRQLKKLRAETKGTDIGDLTSGDRLNHNVPNLQYIGNPVDTGIDSYEDFTEKDNKLQTIAFKSKLVNKSIKENKKETMKKNIINEHFDREEAIELLYNGSILERDELEDMDNDELQSLLHDFELEDETESMYSIQDEKVKTFSSFSLNEDIDDELEDSTEDTDMKVKRYKAPNWENRDIDPLYYEDDEDLHGFDDPTDLDDDDDIDDYDDDDDDYNDNIDSFDKFSNYDKSREEVEEVDELDSDDDIIAEPINELEVESVKTFEAFSEKEEKQPDYTMWGKEKEPKSDPNFGYAAVRAQEIKKITDFNLIDPPTPKERTIGGNSGVFIDNDIVKGYVNRIEGKDVYVESLDNPLVIQKFSLKDAVKTKK